ncbi:MAG: hypothetical protein V2A53_06990 [bacterium]
MKILLAIAGCILIPVILQAEESSLTQAPAKVTKVIFYKHGMGYFERQAKVSNETTISLGFKASQMKDVLTSFFAIDLDGGKIKAISYDSKDPIGKQLENILINVPEESALIRFLTQLKGAKVELRLNNETIRGNILGIEPISQKESGSVITNYKLILLNEQREIVPYSILEINSFKLLDEPIQRDLNRILDISLKSKYTDRKQIDVFCTGKGNRNIIMGYLVEMPIWKTSYRLILEKMQKPYLQGWAIVENPTDEDWEDVNVSFVAGNPISFIIDLYTSYYPERQEIEIGSIIPQVKALIKPKPVAESKSIAKKEMALARNFVAKEDAEAMFGKEKGETLTELMQGSVETLARGVQVGELFAYEAKTPVSIGSHKAAMVPIITECVDVSKTLYWRADISAKPLNSLYLKNSTKLFLEPGPITVFEDFASIGEGLLKQSLKPDMAEIIPYGIENGCTIEPIKQYSNRPFHKCRITNGILVSTYYSINETIYKICNKTNDAQALYLDHPRSLNYTLIEPKKAEEEPSGYYRFRLNLASGEDKDFKVQEQMETSSQISLQNISMEQIKFYLTETPISEEAKRLLSELEGLMEQIAQQKQVYNETNAEYERLLRQQNEYRQNLQVLKIDNVKERAIREKWVEKLDKNVEQTEELKGIMKKAQEKQNQLQNELIGKIQGFNEE